MSRLLYKNIKGSPIYTYTTVITLQNLYHQVMNLMFVYFIPPEKPAPGNVHILKWLFPPCMPLCTLCDRTFMNHVCLYIPGFRVFAASNPHMIMGMKILIFSKMDAI